MGPGYLEIISRDYIFAVTLPNRAQLAAEHLSRTPQSTGQKGPVLKLSIFSRPRTRTPYPGSLPQGSGLLLTTTACSILNAHSTTYRLNHHPLLHLCGRHPPHVFVTTSYKNFLCPPLHHTLLLAKTHRWSGHNVQIGVMTSHRTSGATRRRERDTKPDTKGGRDRHRRGLGPL